MTTFTMQDLTETPEEKEAFDAVAQAIENRKIFDNIQPATKEQFMEQAETIQGATGAQYTPIDLKQFHKPIEEINKPNIHQLAQQLTQSFNTLINAILELQAGDKQPVSSSVGGDLHKAVDVVLEQAEWFSDKLNDTINDTIDDRIESRDFSYEFEQAVESHFSNSFSLDDHIDVASEIESIVDDRLDDMVQEKVEEYLREKLSSATISFN